MTVGTADTWRALLTGSGLEYREATWIAQQCCGLRGAAWLRALDTVPDDGQVARFAATADRRRAGEPLQYAIGRWVFRDLELHVGPAALIPRPETEEWVGSAVAVLRSAAGHRPTNGFRLADLGTGSGAIALSLADGFEDAPDLEIWATDRSPDSLDLARRNRDALMPDAPLHFSQGDWYSALPASLTGRLSAIFCNPPYLARHELAEIDAVVADWEPVDALVAGDTGLEALAEVIAPAPRWLEPGGFLFCEIAPHQADSVEAMARAAGFGEVDLHSDLAGRNRCLQARL